MAVKLICVSEERHFTAAVFIVVINDKYNVGIPALKPGVSKDWLWDPFWLEDILRPGSRHFDLQISFFSVCQFCCSAFVTYSLCFGQNILVDIWDVVFVI